jgi:probable rRNA maturation factor
MGEPPSPTPAATVEPSAVDGPVVVGADERDAHEPDAVPPDVERWVALARAVLVDEGRSGELTLTFVDRDEIAALNAEHLAKDGPTDVLSFPLDDDDDPQPGVPVLLGDVVVCPAVAAEQAPTHAGTLDDELALLVVHGVLHVLGHDHAEASETATMRARELALLEQHHWHGAAPVAFRQEHDDR